MTPLQTLRKAKLTKTYWGEIIIAAKKRGKFTKANTNKSLTWATCPCAHTTTPAPYTTDKIPVPVDEHLRHYGCTFASELLNNQFSLAASTLVQIEARASALAIINSAKPTPTPPPAVKNRNTKTQYGDKIPALAKYFRLQELAVKRWLHRANALPPGIKPPI